MNYPLHGSQHYHGEGACITQRTYEPCHAGPPKTDGSYWRVLMKQGLLEEEMANHSSILDMRIPSKVCQGKKMWHKKLSSQVGRYQYATGEEQLPLAPKRMKQIGQSKNDPQSWMCPLVKVKSDVVRNVLHRNLEC